jgi:hypothetical protein
MKWETKRQGELRRRRGEAPVFVLRQEIIETAHNEEGCVRKILLKTLLKAEKTKRTCEMLPMRERWLEVLANAG